MVVRSGWYLSRVFVKNCRHAEFHSYRSRTRHSCHRYIVFQLWSKLRDGNSRNCGPILTIYNTSLFLVKTNIGLCFIKIGQELLELSCTQFLDTAYSVQINNDPLFLGRNQYLPVLSYSMRTEKWKKGSYWKITHQKCTTILSFLP